ncbi:MAG TPA: hypothetical protein DEF39_01395 [Hungateiclostridium thermocellum]|uniref:Uncharacterized protein n=1 Tax=Acetivibrio thermocellus (strain ATCC 27405 / DSM 1237 / JCM 9322 / NBRC 103400 / NCIMB 10682 / NRRL B-4536 / VPI 7372) TaxID=203119 RepID=A3DKB1_ACET2|nr:hypothetical protein [Acetivibrio thermocellus]ABN54390.1 hypothetical protein Cthe_3195 [Acetivibrio thermocellus ATCC 27405]HBW25935.1 hypothetical protein [Acetivibrio thermocellus]HOP93436.1 hypothetical protein [Acetivibrio thermocellus]
MYGKDCMYSMPHMMNIPAWQQQYHPMAAMPVQQLENMYPRTYYIVYPRVQHYCDMMDMNYGCLYCPTKEELDRMCDKICDEVEADVEAAICEEMKEEADRQLGFGGRRLLRAFVGTLLIRELLTRRRPYGFPGYWYGYYGY